MRQSFLGVVVSNAMIKSVRVRVPRTRMHPVVHKMVTKHKNFMAHDNEQQCQLGDVVRIEACRPLSKRKSFVVTEIIRSVQSEMQKAA